MAYASSTMSPAELDVLYRRAKESENFMKDIRVLYDEHNVQYADECDAHHAAYGDTWTDEDEAALEQWEIDKRERLAIQNEY